MAGDPLLQCCDKGGRLAIHYQMVRQNAYRTGSSGIAESSAAQPENEPAKRLRCANKPPAALPIG